MNDAEQAPVVHTGNKTHPGASEVRHLREEIAAMRELLEVIVTARAPLPANPEKTGEMDRYHEACANRLDSVFYALRRVPGYGPDRHALAYLSNAATLRAWLAQPLGYTPREEDR